MRFGERLKGELEYRGMPVKELAAATGIPRHTLHKYLLKNGTMPSADNAVAIAATLGVTVEYLVTGREVPPARTPEGAVSPELRSIAAFIAPLPAEKRKIVEKTVAELVELLRSPTAEKPVSLTLLQKVFLRIFR